MASGPRERPHLNLGDAEPKAEGGPVGEPPRAIAGLSAHASQVPIGDACDRAAPQHARGGPSLVEAVQCHSCCLEPSKALASAEGLGSTGGALRDASSRDVRARPHFSLFAKGPPPFSPTIGEEGARLPPLARKWIVLALTGRRLARSSAAAVLLWPAMLVCRTPVVCRAGLPRWSAMRGLLCSRGLPRWSVCRADFAFRGLKARVGDPKQRGPAGPRGRAAPRRLPQMNWKGGGRGEGALGLPCPVPPATA